MRKGILKNMFLFAGLNFLAAFALESQIGELESLYEVNVASDMLR